jgi:hypothetical protein
LEKLALFVRVSPWKSGSFGRELEADDLLASVRQALGELHHARKHVGITIDRLGVAYQFSTRFNGMLRRTLGQAHQLIGIERSADAMVTRFARLAKHGNAGVVNILTHCHHDCPRIR